VKVNDPESVAVQSTYDLRFADGDEEQRVKRKHIRVVEWDDPLDRDAKPQKLK
jgi:hypothetical protein